MRYVVFETLTVIWGFAMIAHLFAFVIGLVLNENWQIFAAAMIAMAWVFEVNRSVIGQIA